MISDVILLFSCVMLWNRVLYTFYLTNTHQKKSKGVIYEDRGDQ